MTLFGSRPVSIWTAMVSMSTGLETTIRSGLGLYFTMFLAMSLAISTFVLANSRRVCPVFLLTPAVMIVRVASAQSSYVPVRTVIWSKKAVP